MKLTLVLWSGPAGLWQLAAALWPRAKQVLMLLDGVCRLVLSCLLCVFCWMHGQQQGFTFYYS